MTFEEAMKAAIEGATVRRPTKLRQQDYVITYDAKNSSGRTKRFRYTYADGHTGRFYATFYERTANNWEVVYDKMP